MAAPTHADNALVLAVFLLLCAAAVVLGLRLGMGPVNPLVAYFGTWGAMALAYVTPGLDLRALTWRTWALVFASATSFLVGCLAGWTAGRGEPGPPSATAYDPVRLRRAYLAGLALLLVQFGIVVAEALPTLAVLGQAGAVRQGAGLELRHALLDGGVESAQTAFGSSSTLLGLLNYVSFLGTLVVLYAPVLLAEGRRLLGLAPLAVVAVQALLTVQRFPFFFALLLFAAARHFHARLRPGRGTPARARLATLAVLAALMPAVLYLPLRLRQPGLGLAEVGESLALYFVSGLAGLNDFAASADALAPPSPTLGGWTFWGLASLLFRAGLIGDLPSGTLAFVGVQGQGTFVTNTYTYLIYPLLDAGVVGLLVAPWLLGFTTSLLQARVLLRREPAAVPALAVLLTSIALSFFALSLIRDVRYLLLMVVAVPVDRWLRRRT